jgi:hypothetical protein
MSLIALCAVVTAVASVRILILTAMIVAASRRG